MERELVNAGVRCDIDESNEKLGYKIRQCELQKIPYKIIVGEKEAADGLIAVNKRKEGDYRLRRVLRTNLFVHNRAVAGSTPKVCPRVR